VPMGHSHTGAAPRIRLHVQREASSVSGPVLLVVVELERNADQIRDRVLVDAVTSEPVSP
jgi:hypothetical protein